jgi:hypothetical protein
MDFLSVRVSDIGGRVADRVNAPGFSLAHPWLVILVHGFNVNRKSGQASYFRIWQSPRNQRQLYCGAIMAPTITSTFVKNISSRDPSFHWTIPRRKETPLPRSNNPKFG